MRSTKSGRGGSGLTITTFVVMAVALAVFIVVLFQFDGKTPKNTEVVAQNLTITTITGKEQVETGDIVVADHEMRRVEFGIAKESGFVFIERIQTDSKYIPEATQYTDTLKKANERWWGLMPRIIKVGSINYDNYNRRFPPKIFPKEMPLTTLPEANSP